ncbi:hypothetical protein KC343_g3034 [Hortaea werneckii]|nr:hypothetical protein KC323_g4668 [Hortaea werneckii]KAI7177569.1 hypothetical protein KC352_g23973 [Hortaea werneckii]KAI7354808.1 hypothetical protein KC320_g3203 [Hortaea werneckii]KAI7569059.1 hypothetical protein KC317_g3644 [Hortaea werneckii]KAI7620975.1 hypothetical protein KC346_g3856 [Hortaea werneckii]
MAERTTFARSSESEFIDLLSDSDGGDRASLTLENESASQVILENTGDGGDDDDDDDDVVFIQHNPTSARGTTLLHTAISDYGFRLTTGEKVVLDNDTKFHVHRIVQNTVNNTIHLFGWKLIKPVYVESGICEHTKKPLCRLFPQNFNELVAVLRIQQGQIGKFDGNLILDSVPLSRAVGVWEVIYTNRPFPAYSYYAAGIRTEDRTTNGVFFPKTHDKAHAEQFAPAVCRRKFVEEIDLRSKKKVAIQLLWLDPDECDPGKSSANVVRARKFREDITARVKEESVQTQQNDRFEVHGNVPQRGKKRARESGETIDLTDDDRAIRLEERPRLNNDIARSAPPRERAGRRRYQYSFVDICAGGGLVSRAATLAGLEVAAGLDISSVACKSLSLNFPAMEIMEMDVHEFCVYSGFNIKFVGDIMWISWPCQPHSYQNRGQNPERDAKNIATGYALADLIKKYKPRRIIMEQTDGIKTKNQGQHFRTCILALTTAEYNVRYKVLSARDHGGSHTRRRLIVLASIPGEKIPDFPTRTHGPAPGLEPYVTVNECITNIGPDATLHDIEEMRRRFRARPSKLPPVDGTKPLAYIIDTAGVQGLYSDGDRKFTIREQMRLMGLPDEHQLYAESSRNGTKRQADYTTQIGNGVVVPFGIAVIRKVVESLEETDREAEAWDSQEIVID